MKISVATPYLPSKKKYFDLLSKIWESKVLTHNGPLVQNFEQKLKEKFEVNYAVCCTSGTISLQLALKALNLPKGDIVTTPFGWVATIAAILAEGFTPKFADVDPDDFNLSVKHLERTVNRNTVAIMPVHVFGNPCKIEEIKEIAGHYKIPVIYDAAHAVGSSYRGKSVFCYGSVSCTSFHATKVINSGEGGACFVENRRIYERLQRLRFFGFNEKREVIPKGINGKMTELHAALGLASLSDISLVLKDRYAKYLIYQRAFRNNQKIKLQKIKDQESNFSYFPVVFSSPIALRKALDILTRSSIEARRYFRPSLNKYSAIVYSKKMTTSEYISERILCLPLHYDLSNKQQRIIVDLVESSL